MIDISSSGLRFATPGPLGPGRKLAVAIDWPVLLDGRVQLQLILAGTVVWSTGFDLKATVVITAPSVSLTPTAAITPKQAQFPINMPAANTPYPATVTITNPDGSHVSASFEVT